MLRGTSHSWRGIRSSIHMCRGAQRLEGRRRPFADRTQPREEGRSPAGTVTVTNLSQASLERPSPRALKPRLRYKLNHGVVGGVYYNLYTRGARPGRVAGTQDTTTCNGHTGGSGPGCVFRGSRQDARQDNVQRSHGGSGPARRASAATVAGRVARRAWRDCVHIHPIGPSIHRRTRAPPVVTVTLLYGKLTIEP